ncbi:MAG: hypothetical protein WCL50_08820 [Spirochaetota bacterium]
MEIVAILDPRGPRAKLISIASMVASAILCLAVAVIALGLDP